MEGLKEFLSSVDGGSGFGDDGGDDGSGSGFGYGYGYGSGYGGNGYGCGESYGSGYGSGYGYGSASGDGYGYGIKSINGCPVCLIDDIYTVVYQLHGDIAKGAILSEDLSLEPCYVVKRDGVFAHGGTLREAQEALISKFFDTLHEAERIDAFCDEFKNFDTVYPVRTFFEWHHRLTGSCEAGRRAFAKDHALDIENGAMSVWDFLNLTKDAYGGSTIRKVLKREQRRHSNEA